MKRVGLRAKFIFLLSALLIVLFAAVAIVLVTQNTSALRKNLDQESRSFATLATQPIGDAFLLYKDSGHIRIEQQINKFLALNPDISGIQIVDTKGQLQFDSLERRAPVISAAQAASFSPIYQYDNNSIFRIIQPLQEDFGARRFTIVYDVSNTRLRQNIEQVVAVILTFCVIALCLSVILSYQLIYFFFLRPVRDLSASAMRISWGNLEHQVKLRRDDEIGDLAKAVNDMANSLKADIQKLQEADKLKSEFMMITSHNLRTPISIIKGYLDMAKDLEVNKQAHNIFQVISINTTKLGTFTEDMLAISSIESGQLMIHPEVISVKPLIDELAEQLQMLATQKKLQIIIKNDLTTEKAALSHSQFKSALWNLLDNAIKFTPGKGTITFIAKAEGKNILISVKDTGIGISEGELPKLFTKFHRGTNTLQYDYEGTGIGLYLTKLIVNEHGGSISVDSKEGTGSTFTVTIKQQRSDI